MQCYRFGFDESLRFALVEIREEGPMTRGGNTSQRQFKILRSLIDDQTVIGDCTHFVAKPELSAACCHRDPSV
jgi:hypothetical protein